MSAYTKVLSATGLLVASSDATAFQEAFADLPRVKLVGL